MIFWINISTCWSFKNNNFDSKYFLKNVYRKTKNMPIYGTLCSSESTQRNLRKYRASRSILPLYYRVCIALEHSLQLLEPSLQLLEPFFAAAWAFFAIAWTFFATYWAFFATTWALLANHLSPLCKYLSSLKTLNMIKIPYFYSKRISLTPLHNITRCLWSQKNEK